MSSITIGSKSKKSGTLKNQNPVESFKDLGSNMAKSAGDNIKKMGSGIFDQFFGAPSTDTDHSNENYGWPYEQKKPAPPQRKEFSLFNYQEHYEKDSKIREIKELIEQIKKEIELIKKADTALLNEVKDIQNLSLDAMPEKPGIYHVRFFEMVLSILRTLRAKIGESRTWMQAMVTKRKKRGSLFASLSKKKGTMYSLSQELQSARSVQ